jgi:hypothetical protein
MKRKKELIAFLCFAVLVTVLFVIESYKRKDLLKRYKFIQGEMLAVQYLRNSGRSLFVKYQYRISDRTYIYKHRINCPKSCLKVVESLLTQQKVLVAYDSTNYRNNTPVLTPDDIQLFSGAEKLCDTGMIKLLSETCKNCK